MEAYYYGLGFTATIPAIVRLAAAQHPERWVPSAIPKEERSIWEDIEHGRLAADLAAEHLTILLPKTQRGEVSPTERLCDFQEAKMCLRDFLVAGKVCAQLRDKWGCAYSLPSQFWESDIAEDVLLSGELSIPDEDGRYREAPRIILIPESEIEELLQGWLKRAAARDEIHRCTAALNEKSAKDVIQNEMQRRKRSGLTFNQTEAEKLIKSIDPSFDRAVTRNLFADVKGSRERGRPSKLKN